MTWILYLLVQILLIVGLAPLVMGLNRKVKALSQKRKGAPLLQTYFDLAKLIKKQGVISQTASWIFKAAPYVVFSTAVAAALLVPVTSLIKAPVLPGDIILLVYLLALGRFFMILAGLDTASTFGGMGSSREAMISALMEPSILVAVFTVGLAAKTTSIAGIMKAMALIGTPLGDPAFVLVFFAFFIIILGETSRIPVDDPATHLELTMVHEAMLLEYSGRHLALMEWGAAIKELVFITLVVNLFLPHDQLLSFGGSAALLLSLGVYVLKVGSAALIIAGIEVFTVKFRFFSVPNLAAISFILSFLGFLQYFVLGR